MNTVQIPADLAEEIWADLRCGYDRDGFRRDARWRPTVNPGDKALVLARGQARQFDIRTGLVARIPTEADLGGLEPFAWLDLYLFAQAWAIIAVGKPGDRALVIDAAAKYPRGKVGTVWVADDLLPSLLPSDGTTARWPIREWAILPAPLPVAPESSETTTEPGGEPLEPPMSLLSQSASLAEDRRTEAAANPDVWRVGGSPGTHGRNIYRGTEGVAVAFEPADAERIVNAMNTATERANGERAEQECPRSTAILPRGREFAAALLEFAEQAGPFFLEDRDGAFEQVITTDQGVLPVAVAVIDMALLETLRELIERLGIGES